MSRRQNSSCDQCRKGKRACDAVWLRDRQIQRATAEAGGIRPSHGGLEDEFDFAGPCTNCARTNKQCTFEWVQSQQQQRKERQALASHDAASQPNRKAGTQATESQSVGSQSPPPSDIPLRPLRSTMPTAAAFGAHRAYPYAPQHAASQQILLDGCAYPSSGQEHFNVPNPVTGVSFVDGSLTTSAPSISLPGVPRLNLSTADASGSSHPPFMDVSGVLPDYSQRVDYSLTPFNATSYAGTVGLHDSVSAVWSSPTVSSATAADDDPHTRKRRRTQSPARPTVALPWAITGDNQLARLANGNLISETMMKIYHDVMEGALSCWLTEQSCPYNTVAISSSLNIPSHLRQQQQQLWATLEDMQREWGPNWSNRVYRRVTKLDQKAHLLGLRRLRPADERKVASALNAAVMAFTAQWAQASQRSSARWQSGTASAGDQPLDLELGDEFDRTLQKSFWNQARKALDDCSEIDSFRIVFAEIIFGLTQKYAGDLGGQRAEEILEDGGDTSQVVEDILGQDTQQVWLERATRRLQVLRRRVDLYDLQVRHKRAGDHSCYDAECRKTIDLLFWFAVMCDTISAAMTERPLMVSDEDSRNLNLAHPSHHDASAPVIRDSAKRWNVILEKDLQTKITSLRWPCPDTEIARELTDAAPVKVLLYRKVTRLQTLITRDKDPSTIEEAIQDSLMVYTHWQAIYSGLFSDCVENHLILSARIQSWYVCLFGHWLLATLLLVDLIEIVDQRGMGGGSQMRRRIDEGTVSGIRRSSVVLVSDLARASTPRHDDYGELENFHHAINEGALLTEPWTMILIRTFSRASIILLEGTVRLDEVHADDAEQLAEERGSFERCEDCVKALWYLGRKSDMAREVASVLGFALQRERLKAVQ